MGPLFPIFLFPGIVMGGVGLSGELSNTPTYSECLSVGPAYACDAEHGNGFVGGEFDHPGLPDVPDRPDVPDVPDEPDDDDQCDDDSDQDDVPDEDRDRGHGNNPGGFDPDNPGKGKGKGRK